MFFDPSRLTNLLSFYCTQIRLALEFGHAFFRFPQQSILSIILNYDECSLHTCYTSLGIFRNELLLLLFLFELHLVIYQCELILSDYYLHTYLIVISKYIQMKLGMFITVIIQIIVLQVLFRLLLSLRLIYICVFTIYLHYIYYCLSEIFPQTCPSKNCCALSLSHSLVHTVLADSRSLLVVKKRQLLCLYFLFLYLLITHTPRCSLLDDIKSQMAPASASSWRRT